MQTYYIGNGKVTEGGHDREATREELIEFLRAGSEDRVRDTENHRQMIEKINERTQNELTVLRNFYAENSGAVSKDFPQTLSYKYLGNGEMQIGDVRVKMSRQFLIEHLNTTNRLLDTGCEEVKKLEEKLQLAKIELATYFRKSVENNETECRNIEVVLCEEKKYETDFLVVVFDFPVDAPNEVGWSTNVPSPIAGIAGVRMYKCGWGFVNLSNYEKQAIGKFFDECKMQRGKWYWCSMSYYPDSAIVVK